jgi:flagellar basal-body rod modification protein FlgD
VDGVSRNLTQSDYFSLMTAQLRYQDPFAPADGSQTLTDSVQFQTLQQLQQLNSSVAALGLRTQITEASALIGRQVQALDSAGQVVSGTVSSVVLQSGVPLLQVNGQSVDLDSIIQIQ